MRCLRTTLNIDADVLAAIKEIAKRESRTAGAVASELIRAPLTVEQGGQIIHSADEFETEFGFRPFARRGGIVTDETINRLREGTADL
jgi:hypothetical protein